MIYYNTLLHVFIFTSKGSKLWNFHIPGESHHSVKWALNMTKKKISRWRCIVIITTCASSSLNPQRGGPNESQRTIFIKLLNEQFSYSEWIHLHHYVSILPLAKNDWKTSGKTAKSQTIHFKRSLIIFSMFVTGKL